MRFCPYAQRVHLVLDAKNIPYHTIFINLHEKPEWLVEKSPLLKVPALEIPGQKEPLIESLVICDYLDEKYPEVRLHPTDPLVKARDRILVERFSAVTGPLYKVLTQSTDDMTGAVREVVSGLELYESELRARGTKYFGGSRPGMLDYMIWPWCERSEIIQLLAGDKFELDRERFAKLVSNKINLGVLKKGNNSVPFKFQIEWRDVMKTDQSVKTSIVSAENHFKFLETRKAGNPNFDLLA